MKESRVFPARLDQLYDILHWVGACAKSAGFPEQEVLKIEIALEEAVVNVMHYAYPEERGALSLAVDVETHPSKLEIVLSDSGIPFNPLVYLNEEKPDYTQAPLESRPIGGCGIPMVVKMMDRVEYERKDDQNQLRMIKTLAS